MVGACIRLIRMSKTEFERGSEVEPDYEHAEFITVCQDCDFAVHWETDEWNGSGPGGEDLGLDHYEETDSEHGLVQIEPSDDFDRERWPTVAKAMETEPGRTRNLGDREDIEKEQLFDEAYEMLRGDL